jgi:hypothetical protein
MSPNIDAPLPAPHREDLLGANTARHGTVIIDHHAEPRR